MRQRHLAAFHLDAHTVSFDAQEPPLEAPPAVDRPVGLDPRLEPPEALEVADTDQRPVDAG